MLLQGCSIFIAETGRFGPDPDWKFTRRPDTPFVTRQDVERMLGSPAGTERIADGQLRAVYEYTVREGRWPRNVAGNYTLMMYADLITLFAAELIFIPLTHFNKAKRTYEKEPTSSKGYSTRFSRSSSGRSRRIRRFVPHSGGQHNSDQSGRRRA